MGVFLGHKKEHVEARFGGTIDTVSLASEGGRVITSNCVNWKENIAING